MFYNLIWRVSQWFQDPEMLIVHESAITMSKLVDAFWRQFKYGKNSIKKEEMQLLTEKFIRKISF